MRPDSVREVAKAVQVDQTTWEGVEWSGGYVYLDSRKLIVW